MSAPDSSLYVIEKDGRYWACGGQRWFKAGGAHALNAAAAKRIAAGIPGARIFRTTDLSNPVTL